MGRLLVLALVVASGGIALVAINGPGKDKPKTDKLTPANQSAQVGPGTPNGADIETGAAQGSPSVTIRMKRLRFIPNEITVKPGAIVRFLNKDNVAHTVYEDLGARSGVTPAFQSKRIPPGGSFQIKAGASGSVTPFICTLHPTVMSGRIYVRS